MRVLAAHINVAARGPHGQAGNRHPLDQHEGIGFHDDAVSEGAGIAFVGIADDVFLRTRCAQYRVPLDPGGEGGATTATQAGRGDGGDDVGWRHRQRAAQAAVAVVGFVIGRRQGIGDAGAGERQALLAREVGNRFDQAERQWVILREAGVEHGRNIAFIDPTEANASCGCLDFHQRFEPQHAARAVADDGDMDAALRRFGGNGVGHIVGAQRQRGGVARNKDFHADSFTLARMRSNRAGVTRACTAPSTIMAGETAHWPRQ